MGILAGCGACLFCGGCKRENFRGYQSQPEDAGKLDIRASSAGSPGGDFGDDAKANEHFEGAFTGF